MQNNDLLFRNLLNESHDMLFILRMDEDITVTYANQTAIKTLGYTVDEINRLGIHNLRKPLEKSQEFTRHLQDLHRKQKATDYALLICKDLHEIPVEVNAKIIQKDGVTYNIAIARDISERLAYEKQLKQEIHDTTNILQENLSILQSYQKAIDTNSIITIANIKGIITYANDNFCNLSLYTRDEVLGKPHSIVRHEDTKAELFTDLWKTILSKKVWRGEIKNRKKDGNFYIVDTVIAPILDENRAIREFLSIRHDITELKTKQAQLDTLANTDYLTGLQNRFSLNEKLARATSGQIALIDINRFHEINDFYGENIGDKVIKAVANQIQIQHSDSHQVFRLQGDQFIIFNTTQSQEQFQDEMLRLNNFLSNKILIIENKIFYISTTLALSFEEPTLLLSTVNLAKTYAKQKGLTSNVYSLLTSLEEQYKENLKWDYKIRKALLEHRFVVYFSAYRRYENPRNS
ncbi:MAG: PAS domain S-box protein [Sulfurimonas sp.]|nr:PAS domain S-box protein [Sulfurimonas sp.]MDD5203556.1 PAS domain S-box protein [Sulfurimonas sp.]